MTTMTEQMPPLNSVFTSLGVFVSIDTLFEFLFVLNARGIFLKSCVAFLDQEQYMAWEMPLNT